MKKYESPLVEVIEIELEGMLCQSSTSSSIKSVSDGGSAWDNL